MIKCIIVEDDPKHSDRLIYLLKRIDMSIEVLSISTNVKDTLVAIKEFCPELIFLDIELERGEKGFEVLTSAERIDFEVIFTTAYIDKNIQEIRVCGITYIAKPYILEELEDALEKYKSRLSAGLERRKINTLRENIFIKSINEKSIWIANKNSSVQLKIGQIIFCESDNQYTIFNIITNDNKVSKYVSSRGLGEWEKDLNTYGFCRIHRSYLVNTTSITEFQKSEDKVLLASGHLLDVSKSGKEELQKITSMKG